MALTPKKPEPDKQATSDEVFLREVDDAVRAGDLENFWKRYGRWLLGAVITGLLAFGGYIYWTNHQQAASDKQSEAFVDAVDLLQAGDEKSARAAFEKLSTADQDGYRAMSQMILANIDAENGDVKKAIAAYKKIEADESLPQSFRELALIRGVAAEFDTIPPQQVVDRLKPVTKPGNPWFGSAGELTAMAYLKMGKDGLAGPIFAQIAKQENLPQSLRSRATQMAGALGVDAVQLNDKEEQATEDADAAAKGDS